jgi:hypothetical protein
MVNLRKSALVGRNLALPEILGREERSRKNKRCKGFEEGKTLTQVKTIKRPLTLDNRREGGVLLSKTKVTDFCKSVGGRGGERGKRRRGRGRRR